MNIQIYTDRVVLYENNNEIIAIDINGDIKKSINYNISVLEMETIIEAWKEWKNPKLPSCWILESVLYPTNDSLIIHIGNKSARFIFDDQHTLNTVTQDISRVIQYLSNLGKIKH
jgi:hypothetical protein